MKDVKTVFWATFKSGSLDVFKKERFDLYRKPTDIYDWIDEQTVKLKKQYPFHTFTTTNCGVIKNS